ncbi:MAG: agmatine deiminase family protein [candidate division Zixibacteria bacterium]|nr:agmatine deiminase family protein [Candidatus Tariuqbacter arcticus]
MRLLNIAFTLVLAFIIVKSVTAQPPPQPVVNPAEFEPMSGVIVAFPPPVPMSLVAEISEDAIVMSVVPDVSTMQSAINAYGNSGVNLNNCTFLICPASANLARDNGPWYIFDGLGFQGIADNIHNQGTPVDSLPWYIGDSLNIPVYQTNLVIQGGNWMSDGMGCAMSSGMVYTQNPNLTQSQIHDIVQRYLGIENYMVFDDCGGYGNAHIDTWGKFIDPGKVIIKRYNPPAPELEALAHYISTLKSSYGRPYEVIRIEYDYTTSYTNSLFMNNKVLVPTNNGHPLDSLALRTYQEAMPGYEVLGFGPGWGPGNALHCRTMGITDRYMLRITHIPIFDQENFGQDFPVQAAVHAYSNTPLLAGMPQVYWKVEGGNYNILTMTHTAGDSFLAVIPSQPDNTDIYYYIHAEDDSSRSENHPYIGTGNPHHFYVGPDIEPPTVETIIPETILPLSLPLTITAEVRDNRWISSVTLEYSINGVPVDTLEMTLQTLSAVVYEAEFDPPVTPGDHVQLRIKAVDNSTNQNTAYAPEFGYYEINIVGELRACVWNPCGQPSGQAIFDLLQTGGIQCFYTEEEPVSFNRFVSMFICLGSWPSTYDMNLDQVDKITDYIQSGHCIYLEGADCWAYSPYHDQLSEAFGIVGIYDGPIQSSINPLLGVASTFTSGMSFNSNNTHYVDRIAAAPGSDLIFVHADTAYGVIQDNPDFKTVGCSFEFGGLNGNNPSSSQQILLRQILRYFRSIHAEVSGSDIEVLVGLLPDQYALFQNHPNPFNSMTTISFGLPQASRVKLIVYDLEGRMAGELVDGMTDAGIHEVTWDASNLASGIYFYRIQAGDFTSVKKMALVK